MLDRRILNICMELQDSDLRHMVSEEEIDKLTVYEEIAKLMQETQEEMEDLLNKSRDSYYVEQLTFSDLLNKSFPSAQTLIRSFSIKKRIDMLNDAQMWLDHLYEQTNKYVGVSKDELITAEEFRSFLGKIKHIEIIQQWLYGIE